jgi:hypothetical protein
MNQWLYRTAMALVAANLVMCVYLVYTQPRIRAQCINGVVMVPSRDHSMYVQRAVFVAERCMAIDTD